MKINRLSKLVQSCPTCAGFNWEVSLDTGIRTTFHCESYKLEVKASAKLEALKIQRRLKEIPSLTLEKKKKIKERINAIFALIENEI